MTETPFDPSEISAVAKRLDELHLPAEQRAVLSAIIDAAAKASRIAVDPTQPVPSFQDQFASAFTAGLVVEGSKPTHITRAHRPT